MLAVDAHVSLVLNGIVSWMQGSTTIWRPPSCPTRTRPSSTSSAWGACRASTRWCKDDNCYFSLQTLFILTATYWVFMVLLGGIVIPGGLFMPSIMVNPSEA